MKSTSTRAKLTTALGALALSSLALATALPATAGPAPVEPGANPYNPTTGHPYRHGAQPTLEFATAANKWTAQYASPGKARTDTRTLSYGGGVDGIGVTTGSEKVYLVVYGSQWGAQGTDADGNATFTGDAKGAVPRLQQMFKGLGTGGEQWSGVMTQYCEGIARGATSCPSTAAHVAYPSAAPFAGIWYDNSVASPANATANQLGTEAVKAASHFGNTTAASNRNAQYVILSPTGMHPDGFNTPNGGFCAWHDWNGDPFVGVSSTIGDVAFTNFPYVTDMGTSCGMNFVNSGAAGTLDGVTMVEGHEYAETITDQNPAGGWTNMSTSRTYAGQENADECSWIAAGTAGGAANVAMGNGSFAMQATWSNDTNSCAIAHATVK